MASESTSSKTFIGNFETCIRDNLVGFVAAHPGLKLLEDFNVVFHEENNAKPRVSLISGGGSGHEPSQTGFVGPGMLTASVAGEIFASPSAMSILSAIQTLAPKSSGILLIVPNYTGDCLNFGLALERARLQGIDIESVTVAEDCAFKGLKKTAGRRGLCGIIFVHKIAGALAAEGRPLKDVRKIAQEVVRSLGTISISLTPCNIPGRGASFHLKPDEIELGLGIHGEAGVERLKIMPAGEVVEVMFNHMTDVNSISRIDVKRGDRIALLVNNLGGLSQLEFNIFIKELVCLLESKEIVIERMYCGALNTSLDMAGVSFSILILNDAFKACLDAPTTAPAWPKVFMPCNLGTLYYAHTADLCKIQVGRPQKHLAESIQLSGPMLTPQSHKYLLLALEAACKAVVANESHLNSLDLESGDGDCGSTLRKGAEAILASLNQGQISAYPRHILLTLASLAEIHMGGSSGALYSLFFTAGSGAFDTDCSAEAWLNALKAGVDAIIKHGGASVGDRTMLDVLWPAYLTLKDKLPLSSDLRKNFTDIRDTITVLKEAAKKTAMLAAKAGRASYVNPERLKNPDPGAEAVALWFSAVLETFISA